MVQHGVLRLMIFGHAFCFPTKDCQECCYIFSLFLSFLTCTCLLQEWENIREHDVLFLLTVRATALAGMSDEEIKALSNEFSRSDFDW